MNNLKNRFLLPTVLVVSLLMVGVLTASLVSAQDSAYPTIIERLSSRFNLNKDEVQQVFEEVRDEHKADMYARWADRLGDFVAEGKITEDQKQAILDKHEEVEAKMEEIRSQNLTEDERREKVRALHDELRSWSDEQGLNFPFMMFRFGKGMMMHGFKGEFFNESLN